jgi:hypothetical protein
VRLDRFDRFLWCRLSRICSGWRSTLVIVKPETVLAWPGLPPALALEESASRWPPRRVRGPAEADSDDVGGESAFGALRASTANC